MAAATHNRPAGGRQRLVALAWAASVFAAVGMGWIARDILASRRMAMESAAPTEILAVREAAPVDAPVASSAHGADSGDPASQDDRTAERPPLAAFQEEESTEVAAAAGTPSPDVEPDRHVARAEAAGGGAAMASRAAGTDQAAIRAGGIDPPVYPGEPVVARGRVLSPEGQPIQGAVVVLDAETTSVTSDDGSFSLVLRGDDVGRDGRRDSLTAQALGFARQTVPVPPATDTATLDIIVHPLPAEALASGTGGVGYGRVQDAGKISATTQAGFGGQSSEASPPARVSLAPAAPSGAWELSIPRGELMSLAEASRRLGTPVVTIPGLEILSIELIELNGGTTLVVRHQMDAGGELVLLESADPSSVDVGRPDGVSVARTRRGSLELTAVAPIDEQSLTDLLESAR